MYNTCTIILCKQSYKKKRKYIEYWHTWNQVDTMMAIFLLFGIEILRYCDQSISSKNDFMWLVIWMFFYLFFDFGLEKIIGYCLVWYTCLTYSIGMKIIGNDVHWWSWNKTTAQALVYHSRETNTSMTTIELGRITINVC